jgi:hypothetical protein
MDDKTYTVAQAAKKLHVSLTRIRQLIEAGRLHPINEPAPLMLAADLALPAEQQQTDVQDIYDMV